MTFRDSACNRVSIKRTGLYHQGCELLVCGLIGHKGTGYVAIDDGEDRFGTDECPDGPPVCGWFGPGQAWPTARRLIHSIMVPELVS